MLKSFPTFISRIKKDQLTLRELIRVYHLDVEKPLIPQIEQKLGRELSMDEIQTIKFAENYIKDGWHNKRESFWERIVLFADRFLDRFINTRTLSGGGGGGRRKKKKKK